MAPGLQSSEHDQGEPHLLLLPTGAQTLDASSGTPSIAGTWLPYASHSTAKSLSSHPPTPWTSTHPRQCAGPLLGTVASEMTLTKRGSII